ncbi:reverse transcriptase domain-containing protein [Tanacetum coccineum]
MVIPPLVDPSVFFPHKGVSFPINFPNGLFADPTGSVTLFVRWIKDYHLPDGLKMPSHVGFYDGKRDPNNFLHLFEGAIHMQKSLMHVACHMFTYTLKDSARIWWNSQKACSILNYEDLKAKFRSYFSQQKRFTKTHLAVYNIKQREGETVRAFATMYADDTIQILGLHEDQRISGFVHSLRTRNLVEHLYTDIPSTYKSLMEKTYTWIEAREVASNGAPNDQRDNFESPGDILATEKVARSFEQPPFMLGSRRSRDMSKYCYFHKDYGHDTNDFRQLRRQIEEAVKSGQLSHLVKGIKKERAKTSDSQQGEKKEKTTTLNQEEACTRNSISKSPTFEGREITFPPVTMGSNSSTPVIIKAKIFGREIGRVDSQVPLVGFLGEKSWAIGEVLLKNTIGEAPLSRSETLNFVIVRSNSPYDMLLGRIAMQKIGMVVSTIHGAVKFHTTQGIETVFSTYESDKIGKGVKKIRETSPANTKGVLSCTDAEEKIIINSQYPEQTITIGKQLPEHFKERLRKLLRTNADVFAWTYADMTGIPRTITGVERSLPFFKVLKSCTDKKNIQWTQEAAALQEMKKFMETLPTLTAPIHGEVLIMYLASSIESVSIALFSRREEGKFPIYFVSRVLQGAKLNYPALEKLILALVHAARRLRRYFQARTVAILTNSPIKQALTKPEKSGRVAKWAIELGEHDIVFRTRGAGLMLIDPEGKEYTYALRFELEITIKEAEYEALLAGLRIAQEMKIVNLAILVDSQLLVNQIKGIYATKQPAIREYLQRTKETLRRFRSYTIKHIRRNQNKKADALSKLASMTFEHLTKEVLVEVLARRSIAEKEVL